MRELDELLIEYLERRYEQAPTNEKAAFRALLELSDPELMSYLLQNEKPAADLSVVVDVILNRAYS
jgi:succinate dehydrogenase flavin-adding protein (antitoxin of CptAB toxin-antitoxin module)